MSNLTSLANIQQCLEDALKWVDLQPLTADDQDGLPLFLNKGNLEKAIKETKHLKEHKARELQVKKNMKGKKNKAPKFEAGPLRKEQGLEYLAHRARQLKKEDAKYKALVEKHGSWEKVLEIWADKKRKQRVDEKLKKGTYVWK